MENNLIKKLENMRGTSPLWTPRTGHLARTGDYWDCRVDKEDWNQFAQEWFPMDKDYNQVIDYSFERAGDNIALNLWMTHPRKGAGRGVSIHNVNETDLPQVYAFLRDMGKGLIARFKNVPESQDSTVNPLKLRKGYKGWNPFDDAMAGKSLTISRLGSKGEFFRKPIEVIDFYFDKNVPSRNCKVCDRTGYSLRAIEIRDQLYAGDALSEEDKHVLKKAGRPIDSPSGLDSLSVGVLMESRTKKEGVEHICSECKGKGYIPTGEERLGLNLWTILPTEGKSRGVYIEDVPNDSLPRAYKILREARDVLVARFKGIPQSKVKIHYEKSFPDIASIAMGHG